MIFFSQMLAKLAAGMNKPNQQTILPMSLIQTVFNSTLFKKVLVSTSCYITCYIALLYSCLLIALLGVI